MNYERVTYKAPMQSKSGDEKVRQMQQGFDNI